MALAVKIVVMSAFRLPYALSQIFPTDLWGSKRNMVCLARAVERFIVLRRHETMSVLEVGGPAGYKPDTSSVHCATPSARLCCVLTAAYHADERSVFSWSVLQDTSSRTRPL